jgi:hypothetical protein
MDEDDDQDEIVRHYGEDGELKEVTAWVNVDGMPRRITMPVIKAAPPRAAVVGCTSCGAREGQGGMLYCTANERLCLSCLHTNYTNLTKDRPIKERDIFPLFADWLCHNLDRDQLIMLFARSAVKAEFLLHTEGVKPFAERDAQTGALMDFLFEFRRACGRHGLREDSEGALRDENVADASLSPFCLICKQVHDGAQAHCSLCNRCQSDVETLIEGTVGHICDKCVEACRGVLEDNREDENIRVM